MSALIKEKGEDGDIEKQGGGGAKKRNSRRPSFLLTPTLEASKADEDRGGWLRRGLSVRTPREASSPKKKGNLFFDGFPRENENDLEQVHKASTQSPLPQFVLEDGYIVPRFEADELKGISRQPLAAGAQAQIYKFSHLHTGKSYAVKVLKAHLAMRPEELKSFDREVQLLARLNHININSVIGVGARNGLPCAMLQWVESDLTRALALDPLTKPVVCNYDTTNIEPPISPRQIKKIWPNLERFRLATELASAMAYLHSGQALPGCFILHRDIKPCNIGVSSDGNIKLLDFGLAVALAIDPQDCKRESKTCSQQHDLHTKCYLHKYDMTGMTGSRRYMAPEVVRGEDYGLAVDVYSFAIACWEMLALKGKPYAGLTADTHLRRVVQAHVRPEIPKSWHPKLATLLTKAWSPDPDERPSFSVILAELEAIKHSTKDPLNAPRRRISGPVLCS